MMHLDETIGFGGSSADDTVNTVSTVQEIDYNNTTMFAYTYNLVNMQLSKLKMCIVFSQGFSANRGAISQTLFKTARRREAPLHDSGQWLLKFNMTCIG